MRVAGPIVLALCLVVDGCAINPVSGRPEFVLVSEAKEKQMGAESAKEVEQTMGLLSDPALIAYVESVGRRLAEQSPRKDVDYRFFVVDAEEPNAFALPGGYVYVTRGLLALVNSEDELACVIGHEIGHVAARHSVQQMSRAAPFAIITGITAGVTSLASPLLGQVVGGVGGLASGLVLSPFNRDQEREADRIGQQLSAATGWDPAAMSAFLHTLEREEKLRGGAPRKFDFLATHPSTPERVANTAEYAGELQRVSRDPISATRNDFLARLDGLVVGPNASDGVFQGQVFLHPDLDFAVQFPDQWQKQNTRQQVAAAAPDGAALIMLNGVGDGNDPIDGARAFEKAVGSPVVDKTQPITIGNLKAARTRLLARNDQGTLSVELAWIAHAGHVYQLAGITPLNRAAALTPVFDTVTQSFRPLRPAERAGVRENHLRIVEARRDETLATLVGRAHSDWTPDMAAVANALSTTDPLGNGQRVKLSIAEPYTK
ncbi:MAG TPA: M48 family metalloprotease [Candidatus Kryptonia bacterium]|nr:M48 family metalloprotease [Candidatus Kryptonia bacterium]